jgi:hypothetical protein
MCSKLIERNASDQSIASVAMCRFVGLARRATTGFRRLVDGAFFVTALRIPTPPLGSPLDAPALRDDSGWMSIRFGVFVNSRFGSAHRAGW